MKPSSSSSTNSPLTPTNNGNPLPPLRQEVHLLSLTASNNNNSSNYYTSPPPQRRNNNNANTVIKPYNPKAHDASFVVAPSNVGSGTRPLAGSQGPQTPPPAQQQHPATAFHVFSDVLHSALTPTLTTPGSLQTVLTDVSTHLRKIPMKREGTQLVQNIDRIRGSVIDGDDEADRVENEVAAACVALEWLCQMVHEIAPSLQDHIAWMKRTLYDAIYTQEPSWDPTDTHPSTVQCVNTTDPFIIRELFQPYRKACSRRETESKALRQERDALSLKEKSEVRMVQHVQASNWYVVQNQRSLKRLAFRGWRGVIFQRRKDVAANLHYEELEKKYTKCLDTIDHLNVRLTQVDDNAKQRLRLMQYDVEGGRASNEVHQTEITRLKRDLTEEKRSHHSLKEGPLREMQHRVDRELAANRKLCQLVNQLRLERAESAFEVANRQRISHVFDDVLDDDELLVLWANELIQPLVAGPVNQIVDIFQGLTNLNAYVLMIHAMSPGTYPYAVVSQVITQTPQEKLDFLHNAIETLCIVMPLSVGVLIEQHVQDHIIFLSHLFYRFAGCTTITVPFVGPTEEDMSYWTTAVIPGLGNRMPASDVDGIEHELHTTKEVNSKWKKYGTKLQRSAVQTVVTVLKDKDAMIGPLNAEEKKLLPQFSTLESARLNGMLNEEELEVIQQDCKKYFRKLKKIYMLYCRKGGVLSGDDFWKLTNDTKIVDKTFDRKAVSGIFLDVQRGGVGDVAMEPNEFIEALVRIAMKKFGSGQSPSQRFHMLLEKHIFLSNSPITTGFDELKQVFYAQPTQDVVNDFKPQLKKIFLFYACHDVTSGSQTEMEDKEFTKMCTDCKFQDNQLSFATLGSLFQTVQQQGTSSGLLFYEFIEVLAMVSVMKSPTPLLSFHQKFRSFLEMNVCGPLTKKLRL
eukprot:PhF_6_TR29267/c0_g1_i1/m.42869